VKKVNLIYTDSVIVQRLIDMEEVEGIEGFVLAAKTKTGYTITGIEGKLNYIEKLGLAQSIINDVTYSANKED
jgi:hypothetical protein